MSSQPPPSYGTLPSSEQPPTITPSPAATFLARRRPWREFFMPTSFGLPQPLNDAKIRMQRNLQYFRVNYAMMILLVLFLSLLWHPFSMIVFLVIFVAWFFLYFFRDSPLVCFHYLIDDRIVLGVLGVVTIVALVLTHVWLNVLVSILIGVGVSLLHSVFRGIDDLYSDEQDAGGGGLFSVVGSPTRHGYTPV